MISKIAKRASALNAIRVTDETGKTLALNKGSVVNAEISIGRGTGITGPITLKGPAPIAIGSFCAIGAGVSIISGDHPISRPAVQYSLVRKRGWDDGEALGAAAISIGSDCWVGDGATILRGVTIGNGCVVAAGSVVTKSFGDFQIIGGVPAQIIRSRFNNETIELLRQVEWWSWSEAKIDRNREFFTSSLENSSVQEIKDLIRE